MLCCAQDDDHPLYRTLPCLIVEALSPATAGIDEREKWLHYRDIPSLRYYLLVDSEQRRARVRIRDGEDWLEQDLDAENIVPSSCGPVHTAICLDDLYDRTGL
ncbi:MAG: Uma2 family endonuclease [Thiotrichales bacterium]